jgi:fluoride ion exporter CrcB/FEX
MITAKNILWILVLGSVWGVAEIFGKDLLADFGIGGASIWLAAWAILLLSIGRGLWNKVGSSAIIGLVAAAFKFVGPSPNYCHLLGIASLGLFFDLFASSVARRPQWWRHALVGLLTAYTARAFFVAYSVHVAQSERWVEGGMQMALDHVVRGGSVVALAAILLAPLGFRIGKKAAEVISGDPTEDPLTADNR